MKSQVLSIKQMQELIELGIDTSKASMLWAYYEPSVGHEDEKGDYQLEINDWEPKRLEFPDIPTFTLQDILEMLPKIIDKVYFLKMFINCHGKMTFKYDKHPQGDECCFGEQDCENILNAAFNMLKWCIQNNEI